MSKTMSKNDALEDRLGAVLGRSWLVLGVVLGSFWVVLYWFLYYFVEIDVFEKKSFQDASWGDLGSIWVAAGVVLGALGGSSWG